MMITCPNCQSHEIKKNGKTHYGKQNHQCKDCKRQFVLDNTHTIGEASRNLIKNALKERISLRGICRIFDVSLSWLQPFAQGLWKQTPNGLGLPTDIIKELRGLQVV